MDHANLPRNDFGEYPELEKIDKAQRCPNVTGRRHAVQDLSLRPRPRVDIGTSLKTGSIASDGAHKSSWHASVSPIVGVFAQLGSAVWLAARRHRFPAALKKPNELTANRI